ncbi:alpha/beta hydrolase [Streptacidiphilus fuscans]|uniref:Alpha/beta hydrolase n=1 Tax=Streptacidiphilus fuscans TaxID=2789292 RepID=A0A931FEA7_9ACTN|nr:alpha/beta hydrolase [Streptacidiphilus fuscans]MBF9071552.1 alpha/beta hydrolase [Streptacidiphilus fuscans]
MPPAPHTLAYGPGDLLLDVHRPEGTPTGTVLLWHGRGAQERDVLGALAQQAAARGLLVLVPDWQPDAEGAGWSQLRASAAFLRQRAGEWGGDPEHAVLAGWSLGARAALATVLRPADSWDGWRPAAVVGIAGNYLTSHDPRMGPPATEELATTAQPPLPVHLVHGSADTLVDVSNSREFHTALAQHHWPVAYTETATDHAGVVMTEFAPELGRCRRVHHGHALAGGLATADALAQAAVQVAGR